MTAPDELAGRTCPACGRFEPMEHHFCACGEYLAWDSGVRSVAPEAAPEAARPPPDTAADTE